MESFGKRQKHIVQCNTGVNNVEKRYKKKKKKILKKVLKKKQEKFMEINMTTQKLSMLMLILKFV